MKVLEFENIGKLYSLGQVGTGTLSRDLTRWWHTSVLKHDDPYMKIGETNKRYQKGNSDYVWALRDINFTVNQGDVVGIIGKNGSGKSTLLKILSRITSPTKGIIRSKGRIASLLEVGTGFHDDLTGRENIYMNGAILGMTKQEINSKLDEIVDFSGVERYIDTPVKRYSSGMKVRLGFAVAAFLEPEILLVDEVLAVGDAEFQKRAIGKMKSVSKEEGRTVLFVSHNMNSVIQLCNRGILLNEGELILEEEIGEVTAKYMGSAVSHTEFNGIDGDINSIYITKANIKSDNDLEVNYFHTSSKLTILLEVVIKKKLSGLAVGFNLLNQFGATLSRSDFNDRNNEYSLDPGRYMFEFQIPPDTLTYGRYTIKFDIGQIRKTLPLSHSDLHFEIFRSTETQGPIFMGQHPKVSSLFRGNWIKKTICLEKL
ncbi:MAG: ATP-binding cassette domain-containing protein [Muribaculaceae bacterium]|nr:ATP-binding cassette domain-containing protein [Muribaculaceae bacterium]